MDHPVTVRVDHPAGAGHKYPGLFKTKRYERKVLRRELLKRDAFKGMDREELKGHMVELVDVRDAIREDAKMALRQAQDPKAWRADRINTYARIRERVPGALAFAGSREECNDVEKFLDGRCRTKEWKPQDCDIMVAAEMCRWHTEWETQGQMYNAMADALGVHMLSDSHKIWAKRGYFDAVQDNIHGSRVDWIQKGARDAAIKFQMDEWKISGEPVRRIQQDVYEKIHGTTPDGGILFWRDVELYTWAYRSALQYCEDRTTEGRVQYMVDWVKRRDAAQDHSCGTPVDWREKGARDKAIRLRMDDWETRPRLRKRIIQAVFGYAREDVGALEGHWLKWGYRYALQYCEDRTTEGRIRYVVDWFKKRSEEAEREGKRSRLV